MYFDLEPRLHLWSGNGDRGACGRTLYEQYERSERIGVQLLWMTSWLLKGRNPNKKKMIFRMDKACGSDLIMWLDQ